MKNEQPGKNLSAWCMIGKHDKCKGHLLGIRRIACECNCHSRKGD